MERITPSKGNRGPRRKVLDVLKPRCPGLVDEQVVEILNGTIVERVPTPQPEVFRDENYLDREYRDLTEAVSTGRGEFHGWDVLIVPIFFRGCDGFTYTLTRGSLTLRGAKYFNNWVAVIAAFFHISSVGVHDLEQKLALELWLRERAGDSYAVFVQEEVTV